MTIKDFRIGNRFVYNGLVRTCTGTSKWGHVFYENNDKPISDHKTYYKLCESEQLTSDILLSFGAKEIDTHEYELSRFRLKWLEGYQYFYVTDYHEGTYLTKISEVHELQNFYHSMQGSELKSTKTRT